MTILVTNDDGISSEGLWALARELTRVAPVAIVAPDKEKSSIGTAVTLRWPIRVDRVESAIAKVDAYSVTGTPSDCIILASTMLKGKIDMVVSGINHGANLGDDVLISGTVAAAMQGYLRGFHSLAVSVEGLDNHRVDSAAKLAALLSQWVGDNCGSDKVFLNVNVPNLPLAEIKGINITRLSSGTHIDIAREENDGEPRYYRLVRHRTDKVSDDRTDVWAIEQGIISITPLHTSLLRRPTPMIPVSLCSSLFQDLHNNHHPA